MKKAKLVLIIVSVICIILGAAMAVSAYFSLANDTSKQLAAIKFEEMTHTIEESFTKLNIHTVNSSIEILPSPDGVCRIVCDDSEKLYHDVSVTESVQGVQLNINQQEDWQWYEMLYGLYRAEDIRVRVYLPESEYELLHADSTNGDITVAPDFRFQTVNTHTSSGNTKLTALNSDSLTAVTVSGNLVLRNIEAASDVYAQNANGFIQAEHATAPNITVFSSSGGTVLDHVSADYLHTSAVSGEIRVLSGSFRDSSYFETDSGDIGITDSQCGENVMLTLSGNVALQNVNGISLNISTSSGEILIEDALYSENVLCHTDSGAILFRGLDAANLEFHSTSGGVSGNLLSPKNFIIETTSGFVNVPRSDEGSGICIITTFSGNIDITIEP